MRAAVGRQCQPARTCAQQYVQRCRACASATQCRNGAPHVQNREGSRERRYSRQRVAAPAGRRVSRQHRAQVVSPYAARVAPRRQCGTSATGRQKPLRRYGVRVSSSSAMRCASMRRAAVSKTQPVRVYVARVVQRAGGRQCAVCVVRVCKERGVRAWRWRASVSYAAVRHVSKTYFKTEYVIRYAQAVRR